MMINLESLLLDSFLSGESTKDIQKWRHISGCSGRIIQMKDYESEKLLGEKDSLITGV
jgi:hypothetical protein